jgi:hypothetical protein
MKKVNASHIVASTFGILVGLAGIDHGIFEIMQGNAAPESLLIDAIGPAQRFWEHGRETALTIVPSYLISGILALGLGLLVAVWAAAFVHKRCGALVLLLLSVVLFLVGGGFAPIFMALLAYLAATRIRRPLVWRRAGVANVLRHLLAAFWPWALVASVVLFVFSVTVAIFGWPLTDFMDADAALEQLNALSFVMLGLMVLSVLVALAKDARAPDALDGNRAKGM